MTTRASDRHSQHSFRGNAQVIIEVIEEMQKTIRRLVIPLHETVVTGCNHRLGRRFLNLVPGQLLQEELVIGKIHVQRLNDIIPIAPDVRLVGVTLKSIGLSVANDIEPVPRPLLSIVRRGKQSIDNLFPCIRGLVVLEGLNLFEGRRQSCHVKACPTDQLPA
ncbi:MAG: hypothetical protein CMO35_04900 [Verrucomicrobiaceae bacterium]|nr:hypothetical protein [Verrucomicrobiaceae bacterium]